MVATIHCFQQGGTTVGFEKPGTGNTGGPQPSWWKASIGIAFLEAVISFGTLRNISQSKPEMFVSMVEPVFALFGVPLPVNLRRTLEHWKKAEEEIEFHDLLKTPTNTRENMFTFSAPSIVLRGRLTNST